jgi:hypothetical protein
MLMPANHTQPPPKTGAKLFTARQRVQFAFLGSPHNPNPNLNPLSLHDEDKN